MSESATGIMIDDIVLTDEQQAFIDCAVAGNNILVDACIGSGKTTAIQRLCSLFPPKKAILYLTYNRLLKFDAQSKIKNKNAIVTNYHGFAYQILLKSGTTASTQELIQVFLRKKPDIPHFDILVIDEYQDIETEFADMLIYIKSKNPTMQLIAVGDMQQKIYDKTTLDVKQFISTFLGEFTQLSFTKCFRLSSAHAAMLGRVWNKNICGVNDACIVETMNSASVCQLLANKEPEEILCLGTRNGAMVETQNWLENNYPEKFNKKTVYSSISDSDSFGMVKPKNHTAIFTTYDSSKGLERPICVVFDFTKDHWDYRKDNIFGKYSYDVLKNIFCVAASRGKQRIIFVNDGNTMLSENDLCEQFTPKLQKRQLAISKAFDFNYPEDIQACFDLLETHPVTLDPNNEEIRVKTNDNLIDLSPCIGNYQEAAFFTSYDINADIKLAAHMNNEEINDEDLMPLSMEQKVLLLTSYDTKQKRYRNKVELPFITEEQRDAICARLSSTFSHDEDCQRYFSFWLTSTDKKTKFNFSGFSDVIKDNTVYELKFVSELHHEHFLQCALYMIASKIEKGVLWNTRNNQAFSIAITDRSAFMERVMTSVSKRTCALGSYSVDSVLPFSNRKEMVDLHEKVFKNSDKISKMVRATKRAPIMTAVERNSAHAAIAVIDTETNYSDEVMSIGIAIADGKTYDLWSCKYYVIEPAYKIGGFYSLVLHPSEENIRTYDAAIKEIIDVFIEYGVKDLFAYNAKFDYRHLPELSGYNWFDIMKIASYRAFNKRIPETAEVTKTGRLKKYSVEAVLQMLLNGDYTEKHEACDDAVSELRIMKEIAVDLDTYHRYAAVNCAERENPHEIPPKESQYQSREQTDSILQTSAPSECETQSTRQASEPESTLPNDDYDCGFTEEDLYPLEELFRSEYHDFLVPEVTFTATTHSEREQQADQSKLKNKTNNNCNAEGNDFDREKYYDYNTALRKMNKRSLDRLIGCRMIKSIKYKGKRYVEKQSLDEEVLKMWTKFGFVLVIMMLLSLVIIMALLP